MSRVICYIHKRGSKEDIGRSIRKALENLGGRKTNPEDELIWSPNAERICNELARAEGKMLGCLVIEKGTEHQGFFEDYAEGNSVAHATIEDSRTAA